jgi:hypothetical protein
MKRNVKIFDMAFAHEDYCGSKVGGNHSEKIVWDRSGYVESGDIVFFTDTSLGVVENLNVDCTKIAWLIEPREIQSWSYNYISVNHHLFDYIFTYDSELLSISEKFVKNPMWCSWVNPLSHNIHKKTKKISIIASNKRDHLGHILRHQVIDNYKDIINLDVYGGLTSGGVGYKPIQCKSEGLKDYMFSVVIENVKKDHLFTEKIIDCFLTGTIPVYWGANCIDEYFDSRGIIKFSSLEDFDLIINTLTEETYNSMFEYVRKNFEIASKFKTIEDYMYENLLSRYE